MGSLRDLRRKPSTGTANNYFTVRYSQDIPEPTSWTHYVVRFDPALGNDKSAITVYKNGEVITTWDL
jgi:hypothetical protein